MAGMLSADLGAVVVASEGTEGTDAVDALFDADTDYTYLAVYSDILSDPAVDTEVFRPAQLRASIDGIGHHMQQTGSSNSFTLPARGGVGTPFTPNYAPFLKAMGFSESVGASDTTYTHQTTLGSTYSLHVYARNLDDGNWRLKRDLGCRCIGSLSFGARVEPTWSIQHMSAQADEWTVARTFFGSDDAIALDYAGSAITYAGTASADTADTLIDVAATVTVGGKVYPIESGTLDLAMTNNEMVTINGVPTRAHVIPTRGDNSNANGVLNLAMADNGTSHDDALDDVLTKYAADTEAALQIILKGSAAQITIDCPKIQLMRPSKVARGGAAGWDVGYSVNGDFGSAPFGDNGIVMTYAAAA